MTTVTLKPYQSSNFITWRRNIDSGTTFTSWNLANLGDGVVGSNNQPFTSNYGLIGACATASGDYEAYRTPIAFDTSSLPDITTVFSATLSLYIPMPDNQFFFSESQNLSNARLWPIRVVEGTYPFNGPLDNTHFGATVRSNLIGVGEVTDITTINTNLRKVTINLTNLSFINKTGPTRFMILANYDYALTAPAVSSSSHFTTSFYNAQDLITANTAPELTIQHQIVDVPTIASFI